MGGIARVAVFPGTFDPLTNGHMDIIRRASKLFDCLVVAVAEQSDKQPLFTIEERCEMIREAVRDIEGVEVAGFAGLTAEFVKSRGAVAIVRGIRDGSDLRQELELAHTNRAVAGVETVFMLTTPPHGLTSSRLIKQVAKLGGDVSALVPPHIERRLREKLA